MKSIYFIRFAIIRSKKFFHRLEKMKNQRNNERDETFLTLYSIFIFHCLEIDTYGLLSELKLLHERICFFRKCLLSRFIRHSRVVTEIVKNLG